MVPIEVFELRYPWLIEEFTLLPDSAGPGRFRGAHAVSKTFRAVGTEITVSSVSDRHGIQPWGLLGGGAGTTGSLLYQDSEGGEWQPFTEAFAKISPSKFSNAKIAPGARVRLTAPGAGGYGPVAERPHEMVAEDLREGWISPEGACRDYGYDGGD
jgi:N-methylhydantoinase B